MFKLMTLRCAGFKRLDLPERVMFPDGRLLIQGRNESGKSTIMEAIHYALYGYPLRPSKKASNEDVINYGRDEAVVELEFSIDDEDYLVRRVLKKKGGNEHQLNKRGKDGKLTRITSGARSVNDHVLDVLHGIDSEALLNSCLVEQKELGKLEASGKQDRIKAMSCLLNIEAFIEAREGLRRDRGELEKVHSQTLIKVNDAQKASEAYDKAEGKTRKAEERLTEIEKERAEVSAELENLEKALGVIEEMKEHYAAAQQAKAEADGKEAEKRQVLETLSQISESEDRVAELTVQLPQAEAELAEAENAVKVLEQLRDLEDQRKDWESKKGKSLVGLENAERQVQEAKEAKEKLQGIETRLVELAPVRDAQSLIPQISRNCRDLTQLASKIEAQKRRIEEAEAKLSELGDAESRIKELEQREKNLEAQVKNAQQRRYIGGSAAVFGFVLAALYSFNILLPVAGLGVIIVGLYLFISSKPHEFELRLQETRANRERVLGDASRIRDFRDETEDASRLQAEAEDAYGRLREDLVRALGALPSTPKKYGELVNLQDLDSVESLRESVQEDLQTLKGLESDKKTFSEIEGRLGEREEQLSRIEKELKEQQEEANRLQTEINESSSRTGVYLEKEQEIRGTYTKANSLVTEVKTSLDNKRKIVEQKPRSQKRLGELEEALKTLNETVRKAESRFTELEEEHGLNPKDEAPTRKKRDEERSIDSRLRQEEEERRADVEEANETMRVNGPLKKDYPKLLEESEREEFRLESMRRAMVLLDTTRDSIMAGVKQNVEKNMMQFLPALTDNRYSMARIDEEKYVVEVYDKEAQRWRGKGVFSGATQDQFSLALRLAFAVSTIPSTRGARPGFIFLDEPLSGFDVQRRAGFMALLREELSQYFHQIIVISHIEILSEEFPHYLQLDSGKIIEKRL